MLEPGPLTSPPSLPQILKHSLRWSMTVDGRTWTPLCYALAQAGGGRGWAGLWAGLSGLWAAVLRAGAGGAGTAGAGRL